jgi:uncharacterized protein YlaI
MLVVIQHQLKDRARLQLVLCDHRQGLDTHEVLQRRLRAAELMRRLCRRCEVQRHQRRANRPRVVAMAQDAALSSFSDPSPLVSQRSDAR